MTTLHWVVLAACLLPVLLGAGLYWLAGQRSAPRPHFAWAVIAYVVTTLDLIVIAAIIGVSAWQAFSVDNDWLVVPIVPLAIAILQGLVAVYLLHRQQPRFLLGWCLGSLVGLACAVVLLVSLGVLALKSGHGALVATVLLMAVLPQLAFSSGPLAGLPLAWLWHRWAARKAERGVTV